MSEIYPRDAESTYTEKHPYRRHSIFWPLFLVAAGVVFLLSNLGYMTGVGWDLVLKLWPVLIIVGALDGLWRGEGIAGHIFWLGLGVLFLMANFGYLQISSWRMILNFWPVLIIAIGFDILIGRQNHLWTRALAVVLALALLAGIFWFSTSYVATGAALSSQQIDETLQQASSANVSFNLPAGELHLSSGAADDRLVQGALQVRNMQGIRKDYAVQNGVATFTLRGDEVPFSFGRDNQYTWDVKLNGKTPTILKAETGAGELQIDLTGLQIKDLDVNIAVGQATVTLPEKGGWSGKMNAAMGQLVVRVPRSLPVNIQANTAITGISVDPGFTRNGRTITNAGSGGDPVNLNLSSAIGSLRIEYVP